MAWATSWASLLIAEGVETLELSYESLSGRASWKAWNNFAAFMGAGALSKDPVANEPGAFSTPPCAQRIENWDEVTATRPKQESVHSRRDRRR